MDFGAPMGVVGDGENIGKGWIRREGQGLQGDSQRQS